MTNEEYGELYSQAYDLVEAGDYNKAEEICNLLVSVNDKQAPVFNLLSIIKDKQNDLDSSISNSKKAIELNPNDFNFYLNLGLSLKKSGDLHQTLEVLKKATQIDSSNHVVLFETAVLSNLIGKKEESIELLKNLLKIYHNYYPANALLGSLYLDSMHYTESVNYCTKAKNIFLKDEKNLLNLSISLFCLKRYEECKSHLDILIQEFPYSEVTYTLLSRVLIQLGEFEKAKNIYNKVVENSPNTNEYQIKNLRLHIMNSLIYDNKQQISEYRSNLDKAINEFIIEESDNIINSFSNDNLNVTVQCAFDGEDNLYLKSKLANLLFSYIKNYDYRSVDNNSKIKIGFLVTINNEPLFVKFMKEIINNLDSNIFDIYILCNTGENYELIKNSFKNYIIFHQITNDLISSAKSIHSLNLDIIYYWEVGTDVYNYFLPFFRLAPIQCTSIGWPDTTGIPNVDYFISSKLIESENAQDYYSEKLIELDELPLYYSQPILEKIEAPEFFNLDSNKNIYTCCQSIRKIHPDFDSIVKGILKKDNNSLIIFFTSNKFISDILKNRWKALGINITRIIMFDTLEYIQYLNIIKISKVILDTLYFGGATTSYDCFAMDTPVITFPWTHERGRYTLGCYKQMGVKGLVAESIDEYIDLAVKTANNEQFRNKIVEDIKLNKHKLFDDKSLFNSYNDLFKKLFSNHRCGDKK